MNLQKHIDLQKPSDSDKLTIDFSVSTKKSAKASWNPWEQDAKKRWTQQLVRQPWDCISMDYIKGLNFTFTLNPDPNMDPSVYNNKKIMNDRLISLLHHNESIQKAIVVYEWGSKGASHGKLHYHGLIKTNNRDIFIEEMLKHFNLRTAASHRTIHTKHISNCTYRDQYLKYMKKEMQNKIKFLYYKKPIEFV